MNWTSFLLQLESGMIKAYQYLSPPDPKVYLPLRSKVLFQIQFDEESNQAKTECLKGRNGPHELQITPVSRLKVKKLTFLK